ncbi:hypothetical protein [Pinirhizobacter soli]
MAELRDREDIDKIEEQFLVGHAGMVTIASAQKGVDVGHLGVFSAPAAR